MKNTVTALLLINSMALAGDYYGGVDFDFGKGNTEFKNLGTTQDSDFTQTSFGIHGGYYLNLNSKVELSFKSFNFDFDNNSDSDTDGNQFGIDYIYTFDGNLKLKPYIGVGISANSLDIKLANKDTIDGVGFKLRGGTYYTVTPQLDIGIELNYTNISWEDLKDPRDDSTLESSSNFYGFGLNLNYKF